MKTKDYIFFASIIINVILGYWLYDIHHNSDTTLLKELEQSRGREQMLIEQDSLVSIQLDSVKLENQKKDSLLQLKPEEVIIIKNHYYEESNRVISLSYDSSLLYISERLQGVKVD